MGDIISRKALLETLRNMQEGVKDVCGGCEADTLGGAIRCVENAPAADAEPVRLGRWIPHRPGDVYACSECGCGTLISARFKNSECIDSRGLYNKTDFCPFCGVKMKMKKGTRTPDEGGKPRYDTYPEWIDAEYELPATDDSVLVIASGQPKSNIEMKNAVLLATYVDGEGWIVDGYEEWEDPTVHYWMELPELPEED